MSYYTDWNFQILPPLSGKENPIDETVSSIRACVKNFQIHRFCLTFTYDPMREPISHHLLRRANCFSEISRTVEKPIRLKPVSRILLRAGLSELEDLDRLFLFKNAYLPISLPISSYEDWIDLELNRLLYRRKCKLIFESFELSLILYPKEVLERLMRIENAVFSFGYKALSEPSVLSAIRHLRANRQTVLLGTGLSAPENIPDYPFFDSLQTCKGALTENDFRALMRDNRTFFR